jgi:hypothetical protein
MVRYMNIEGRVDFVRVRRRAFLRRVRARIFGDPASTRMRSFEGVSNKLGAFNRVRLGKRVVAVEKIVGSAGRFGDFDRTFLPTRGSLETKWKRVDRAYHRGQNLPPVAHHKRASRCSVEEHFLDTTQET